MTFEVIIGILLAGILSNNYALLHFLGTGAVIENERSSRRSVIVGAGTTIVMVLSTLITWPINKYVLGNATYLQTLVFVIVVICIATCLIIGQLNKSNDEPNKNNDINEKREN